MHLQILPYIFTDSIIYVSVTCGIFILYIRLWFGVILFTLLLKMFHVWASRAPIWLHTVLRCPHAPFNGGFKKQQFILQHKMFWDHPVYSLLLIEPPLLQRTCSHWLCSAPQHGLVWPMGAQIMLWFWKIGEPLRLWPSQQSEFLGTGLEELPSGSGGS